MGQQIISNGGAAQTLYNVKQIRAIEAYAIQTLGVNSYGLMRKAARVALNAVLECWPDTKRLVFFCGAGNNGGDGYAMAAMARNQGLTVLIAAIGDAEKLSADAKTAHAWAVESGCDFVELAQMAVQLSDVLVDAMLGTGQQAAPRANIAAAIALINSNSNAVCAIDMPTGLCANTGCCLGDEAVQANLTVTFIGVKQGLCTNDGPAYAGLLQFDDLGIPLEAMASQQSTVKWVGENDYRQSLQARWANSHKGNFGHVLIVGGNHGFGGAALLAARAAARAGAGLVSVATRAEHISAYISCQAEIMAHAVGSEADIEALIAAATVIVVGPGLGHDEWAKRLLQRCLWANLPTLIDADALSLLSKFNGPMRLENTVVTPHPGEAAYILNCKTTAIQANRFDAATKLQSTWGAVCVLKGAGTVVATVESKMVIPTGNAGMSTGGSGDALSGIIGGLLAQNFSPENAAWLGAYVHGLAGDKAAEKGQRGMLASDLITSLREIMNPDEK